MRGIWRGTLEKRFDWLIDVFIDLFTCLFLFHKFKAICCRYDLSGFVILANVLLLFLYLLLSNIIIIIVIIIVIIIIIIIITIIIINIITLQVINLWA